MARTPSAAQVLGHVVLVTGKEEYLSARTVASVRDAVRAHDADAEFAESAASDLTLASLGEMSAPSLFSSIRCVMVRGLEDLPDESVDGLLAYCAGSGRRRRARAGPLRRRQGQRRAHQAAQARARSPR